MNYARLVTLLVSDLDYCFVGRIQGADSTELLISDGDRVGGAYPADPFSVEVHFDPEFPGLKLPSIIGNTRKLVILSRQALELFEKHLDLGEHAAFPFSLHNHKGRVHSKDYVFFNPIGTHDVAHPSSAFVRFSDGDIYDCGKWILVASKLQGLPDIIRPAELPSHYLVSQRFMDLVKEHKLTNFEVEPVGLV
jgi:hypothetical protein